MEAHVLDHLNSNTEELSNKVIPLTPQIYDSHLAEHILSLTQTVEKIFGNELDSKRLNERLPLVKWTECQKVPSAFQIYLLAPAHNKNEIDLFFHETVSHWLVSGEELQILSSRNLTFQLNENGNRSFYFIELLVHLEKEKHLPLIQRNLPALAAEIKLGALSKGYVRHILEMKRLSFGGKTSYIYETIVAAMRRHPKNFEQDIFRDIQLFLIHCREEFREIRDMRHLCRLILSHYLFNRTILIDLKTSREKRHLYFKLLRTNLYYPFGLKKVVGLAIALNSLRDYECFEERHIQKAVQRILPDAICVHDSFYSYRHDENKILSLYVELEKVRGEDFSLSELLVLRKKLGAELKNSIEYLSPSLFIPRNEEELYRNIIALSQELKYVHDLPQAIISFQEQSNDVLKFNVILLRLLQPQTPSLIDLSRMLSPNDRFIPERVTSVGTLRKKYVKEANIFAIEVEARLFLRKNHSVDLVRARQYVVQTITKLVGNFRDYNGGFLLKQNEQLESIKKEWGEVSDNEFLIENLFYSLTPSIMQTLISPGAGKSLCDLFLKCVDLPLSKHTTAHFEKDESEHSLSLVIKARQSDLKDTIAEALKKLAIDPLKLASGLVEHDGYYYICFLYLESFPEATTEFVNLIEETLQHLAKKQLNLQTIRIFLPHATQALDPRIGADRSSGVVLKMLYEGLMRSSIDGGLECAVAQSYEISADKKRYTFTLKETKWSNGSPVTAYDFEYAWKNVLNPSFRFPYSFLLFAIKNGEKAKRREVDLSEVGITAVDEKTLVIDLEYPTPYFLGLTAHWTCSPLCWEIDQRHPGWAYQSAESHVSNGPYKLAIWKLNDNLAVVKNPNYWDADTVRLGKIEIGIIEDEDHAFTMYKRGELDWFGDPMRKIPYTEQPKLLKTGELHSSKMQGLFWLQLNIDHPIFSTALLRKAFAYAIDRKKLIDKILQRDDESSLRFQSEKRPHHALLCQRDDDPSYAKKLFEEGLKEAGIRKEDLPPIIFSHSEIAEHEALTYEIGREWKRVLGVEVKFERLLWNNYFDALHRRQDYMVGGLSWYPRYDDPLYHLELLIGREGTPRVTKWKNPEFIDLVERAKHATGLEREQLIDGAEQIVLEAMPLIPIFFDKWRYVKNPRLKDVILSTIGQIDFRCAYLEKQ